MRITVDVDTDKLIKNITDDLVDEEGLISELTFNGETYCKIECPVDTGDLMRSITSKLQGKDGIVKTEIEYAKYVIYGTYKQKPNNFPARAVNQIKGELPAIVKKYIKVRK